MLKATTIAFLLATLGTSLLADSRSAPAEIQPCRSIEYDRNAYTICEVDLRKHTLRLFWRRPDGTPYEYLSALPRTLEGEDGRLIFATNAGMFDPALKPVGLYVEQGQERVRVNTRSGYGNFHMKPNGIFFISGDKAAVAETGAFLKQQPRTDLATQSGPMLVINGRAPSFREAQHVTQSAQRCRRTRGRQNLIRYLSGRGVVRRIRPPIP
jgi:uncharacterized protein YigE (DUF2233 family)